MPGEASGKQDAARRRTRRRKGGPEAREEPEEGLPYIDLLQQSCDPAATGVIFAVDVVPLSILAS